MEKYSVHSRSAFVGVAKSWHDCVVMNFFAPNISGSGRVVRAIGGAVMVGGGAYAAWQESLWLGGGLILMGGFTLFEAARGWCIVRACQIKRQSRG